MKKAIGYIPYKNGKPDFSEEEWEQINAHGVGYVAKEPIHHDPETGKIKALVSYPAELEETVKNSPSFEWIEDVEEDSEEV